MTLAATDAFSLVSWDALRPSKLFESLPGLLHAWQPVLITLVFLLVLGGHLWGQFNLRNRGTSIVRQWYHTLLVLAFAIATPALAKGAFALLETFEASLPGPRPSTVTGRCIRLAAALPDVDFLLRPRHDESGELASDGLWAITNDYWYDAPSDGEEPDEWLEDLQDSDPQRWIATEIATAEQARSLTLSFFATRALLVFAGVFAWGADVLRYLALHLGTFVLPLAIAALRTSSFRALGLRLIVGLSIVMLWPALWSIGHMGTGAVFDGYVNQFDPASGTASASRYGWDSIDRDFEGERVESFWGGLPSTAGASLSGDWMAAIVLHAGGLAAWVFAVCLAMPWLMHRLSGGFVTPLGGIAESSSTPVSEPNVVFKM